jgi:hypothetical protein
MKFSAGLRPGPRRSARHPATMNNGSGATALQPGQVVFSRHPCRLVFRGTSAPAYSAARAGRGQDCRHHRAPEDASTSPNRPNRLATGRPRIDDASSHRTRPPTAGRPPSQATPIADKFGGGSKRLMSAKLSYSHAVGPSHRPDRWQQVQGGEQPCQELHTREDGTAWRRSRRASPAICTSSTAPTGRTPRWRSRPDDPREGKEGRGHKFESCRARHLRWCT